MKNRPLGKKYGANIQMLGPVGEYLPKNAMVFRRKDGKLYTTPDSAPLHSPLHIQPKRTLHSILKSMWQWLFRPKFSDEAIEPVR